jgi:hypothetical protein
MKRKVIKFDKFMVWVFTANKGETKKFQVDEINRGLNDHGPNTLYTISVYTKGSFKLHRPGESDIIYKPGDGGARYAITSNFGQLVLESLEDNSEYHCIVPLGDAKFWNRSVKLIEPGIGLIDGGPEKYLYIANGELERNGCQYLDRSLVEIKTDAAFDVKKPTIVATLWT